MIIGQFHEGSGLGNQLHRYVMTRVLAEDKGFEFSMTNPHLFKGSSFMRPDMGTPLPHSPTTIFSHFEENKVVVDRGGERLDIRGYDPEINFIEDNTVIDGEFQDQRYFEHHLDKMLDWFNIDPQLLSPFYDEICVINFRGGEYKAFPNLFLTQDYWNEAIDLIRKEKPDVVFKVVTDDVEEARNFFPDFEITHTSIGDDWTSILHAHYLILSNSSFAILPALLNKNAKKIIAPRYWARRNTKVWALPQNYYSKFFYI